MLISTPSVASAHASEANIDRVVDAWIATILEREGKRIEDRARQTANFWLTISPSCDGEIPACRAAVDRVALAYQVEYEAKSKVLLSATMRDCLMESYTPSEMDELAAFITSPAGKKTRLDFNGIQKSPPFKAALEKRSAEAATIDALKETYQARLRAETSALPQAPPVVIRMPG